MVDTSTQQRHVVVVSVTCALAFVIALIPIWSVTHLPFQDYPSHMARMHILANLENSPELQTFYEIRWGWMSNLAMDALVPSLSKIIPLFDAGRVFVSAIVLMWIAGPLTLHHALFGRVSWWPLLASFFAYNWCLSIGLLNFAFGGGLLFFVLAAWIYSESWPSLWRLSLFSLLASVLFFCHFVAFAIYGVAVVAFEAGRAYQKRVLFQSPRMLGHWLIVLGQFVVPAVIFLFLSPTTERIVPTATIHWGDLWDRLNASRSPVLFEWGPIDYLALLFTAGIFVYALLTRSLKAHPAFLWSLILLSVVAVLMPTGGSGPALTHLRVPPVLAALFFAGTTWTRQTGRNAGAIVFALAVLLFLTRTGITADRWQLQDARIIEFREAVTKIEEGSSLFLVQSGDSRPDYLRTDANSVYPFYHLADYATIDRSAFVPSVFADLGLQPIRQTASYWTVYGRIGPFVTWDELPERAQGRGSTYPKLRNWPQKYDYVTVLNLEQRDLTPPDFLTILHDGSYFTIFKIEKSKVPA